MIYGHANFIFNQVKFKLEGLVRFCNYLSISLCICNGVKYAVKGRVSLS